MVDAKIDYFVDIDLRGNMLRRAVQQTVEALPEEVVEGQVIYVKGEVNAFYIGVMGKEKAEWQKITTETVDGVYVTKKAYDAKVAELVAEDSRLAGLITTAQNTANAAIPKTDKKEFVAEGIEAGVADAVTFAAEIVKKADTETVNAALAEKAVKTEVETALGKKVDKADGMGLVNTTQAAKLEKLAADADGTYATQTALAEVKKTADAAAVKSTVEAALANKIETSVLKTTLNEGNDAEIPSSKAVATFVKEKVAGAYKFVASCKPSDLASKPQTNDNIGDVYNMTEAGTIAEGVKVKAGDNVAWNGTEWDPLGGFVDLTDYAKTAKVTEELAKKADKTTTVQGHALSGNVTITADEITDGVLPVAQVPDLDAAKITTGAFGAARLAANAVETAKINALAVTEAKIAEGAVTTAKIGADAVDGTKIADDAIANEHIAANAVQEAQIQDGAVTDAKIVQVAGSKVNGEIPVASVPMKAETVEANIESGAGTATFGTMAKVMSIVVKTKTGEMAMIPYTIAGNVVTFAANSSINEAVDVSAIGI